MIDTTSCKRRNRCGFTVLEWPAATVLDIPREPFGDGDLLADDASRRPDASRFTGTGDNPRSGGGATVAPPSRANGKAREQAAAVAITVRASVLTWDELATTAMAGALVGPRWA